MKKLSTSLNLYKVKRMENEILDIFKKARLNFTNLYLHPDSGTFLDNDEFEISPNDFLRYAKLDFKEGNERGLVNALTNAKRAIDCQIDTVLRKFNINVSKGANPLVEQFVSYFELFENVNFRLKIIEALDLAPSFIISESRMIRHLLEHYYEKPTSADVRKVIDIASLFVRSIEGKFKAPTLTFDLSNNPSYSTYAENVFLRIYWDFDKKHFKLSSFGGEETSAIIDNKHKLFLPLLRISFSVEDSFELNKSFRIFSKILEHPTPEDKLSISNSWV